MLRFAGAKEESGTGTARAEGEQEPLPGRAQTVTPQIRCSLGWAVSPQAAQLSRGLLNPYSGSALSPKEAQALRHCTQGCVHSGPY